MKRASLSPLSPSLSSLLADRRLTDRQRRDLHTIVTAITTQTLRRARARALALITPRPARAALTRRPHCKVGLVVALCLTELACAALDVEPTTLAVYGALAFTAFSLVLTRRS